MIDYIQEARQLRARLHNLPEKSMQEKKTKAALIQYLAEHTDLEIHDQGCWFYAAYRADETAPSLALRAEMDAVTNADGISRHLCGHDGHAAVLAVLGRWISEVKPEKNLFLLFQPGEESGEGALFAKELFQLEKVDAIYGYHNLPGEKLGQIQVKKGTLNCGSTGLEIRLTGATTHAAYPEHGINPAEAFAHLLLAVKEYVRQQTQEHPEDGILLSTVIGLDMGSNAYGISASEGTLHLTVRAERNEPFQQMLTWIREKTAALAGEYGLTWEILEHEPFPATTNHDECVEELLRVVQERMKQTADTLTPALSFQILDAPIRWSEDFGYYLMEIPGAFFGIGAGESCPQIHTQNYEFPDELIPYGLEIFQGLCTH